MESECSTNSRNGRQNHDSSIYYIHLILYILLYYKYNLLIILDILTCESIIHSGSFEIGFHYVIASCIWKQRDNMTRQLCDPAKRSLSGRWPKTQLLNHLLCLVQILVYFHVRVLLPFRTWECISLHSTWTWECSLH